MFELTTCLQIRSDTTHETWTVPQCFVQDSEKGFKWLQLRFSVSGLCKLFRAKFEFPLLYSPGVQLLLKKRNDAAAALQASSKDKSIFDDSDEEKVSPEAQEKLEDGSMKVKLSEEAVVFLQIPKRKDSEIRVKCDEHNIKTLFEWLQQQDLTPLEPPKRSEKSKGRKRKAPEGDVEASGAAPAGVEP